MAAMPQHLDLQERPPSSAHGLRPWPGLPLAVGGALVPLYFMVQRGHFELSVPLGALGCLVSAWGILDFLGSFDDASERSARAAPWARLVELASSLVVFSVLLRLVVAGVLPAPVLSAALAIPLAFLWISVSAYRVFFGLGLFTNDAGVEARLLERPGFWLIALNALLHLPLLGSFSLIDPWETHYGEVAREMLARDDWLSLWWAQDGWFWSKPVFDFWIQGLSFALFDVEFMPDRLLAGVSLGLTPAPEWAARLPVFLLSLMSVLVLYKALASVYGKRAGFLAGLVLSTLPYWFFLTRQTMTDMPYVAPLAGAFGLLILGFHTPPERAVRSYLLRVGRRTLSLSGYHLLFFCVLGAVLPQLLYLASRNVTLELSPLALYLHPDQFLSGSGGGNCGLPGNTGCNLTTPVSPRLQPAFMAGIWALACGVLLWVYRDERRAQRLYFLGAWFLVALSALAKGAPGLVLPLFCVAVFVFSSKRWRDLTRLELAGLLLISACVILPWYVQMYARHGSPFIDRLLFHDMYKRAFIHVHDTNTGDDVSFRYYVWQLGYGLFPWTGLGAAGLLFWMRRGHEGRDPRWQTAALLALWFISAFAMFSVSMTKFHHYILPAVPPVALLTGVLIDALLGKLPSGRLLALALFGQAIAAVLLCYGAIRCFSGSLSGAVLEGGRAPPESPWLAAFSIVVFGVVSIWSARLLGRSEEPGASSRPSVLDERALDGAMFAVLALGAAATVALVGRDLAMTVPGDVEGQSRLIHLFSYNYKRVWPESLDFSGTLAGFSSAAALLCLSAGALKLRKSAFVLLSSLAVLWTAWVINVYFVKLAPHWGQRETVLAYYRDRKGSEELLVAYQMNWKGENFYTGNRIPTFVSSGEKFKDWLAEQRERGRKVLYFTTEHSRMGVLKTELGKVRAFEPITTKALNNKFFVARVTL